MGDITRTAPAPPCLDAGCIAAGDQYLDLAFRSYAAALVSDTAILGRILDWLGLTEATVVRHQDDAACALAQHLAWAGEPENRIVEVLAWAAVECPAWPSDPEELVFIAKTAIRECAP